MELEAREALLGTGDRLVGRRQLHRGVGKDDYELVGSQGALHQVEKNEGVLAPTERHSKQVRAAAEAALALALIVLLYRRKETLSAEAWSELRE